MNQPDAPQDPAYLYTEQYQDFDYGPQHPLRIGRLALTHQLITACGLALESPPIEPASQEELAIFHDRRYLETLERLSHEPGQDGGYAPYGLGSGDNPIFPGLYQWSALLTGASLLAMRLVSQQGRPVAFNMAGGMHHALAGRASGFCYVNDVAVIIMHLLAQGKRVAYVDMDVHHGDGVQWAFYDSDQVLTISLHQHPATLFPGTGYQQEMGRGQGRGYAVNLPLWPDCDDEIYTESFDQIVPPLLSAFEPDYIVTQLGADSMVDDPLANLRLTTRGFGHCLQTLRSMALGRWIALGGGGYRMLNVARAWTLAWAIMRGREAELPETLPAQFCQDHRLPPKGCRLLDPDEKIRGRYWGRAQREAREGVEFIKKEVFPLLGARP